MFLESSCGSLALYLILNLPVSDCKIEPYKHPKTYCTMDIRNTHFLRCLEALKDAPFFKAMDTDKLKTLLPLMTKSTWAEDTFKSGSEIGMHIHFIVSGRLKVYQINPNSGREHTVAILTKGDIFDIMSLMDTDAHDMYYEAIDALEVSVSYTHLTLPTNYPV